MADRFNTPSRLYNFNATPPTDGLISAWNLENANDSFGGNNLTNNGGVTFTSGKILNAATFDGVNDNLSIDDNASLSIGSGFALSVPGWFRLNALPGAGLLATIFSKWNTGGASQEYILQVGENGDILFAISTTGADSAAVSFPNGTIKAGVWYFFTAWYDKLNVNLELNNNGTIAIASAGSLIFNGTARFRLGARHDDTHFLNGQIDAVRFYKHPNRVLTNLERSNLYHLGMGIQYSSNNIVASDEFNRELDQLVKIFSGFTSDTTPKLLSNVSAAALSINQSGSGSIFQGSNNSQVKLEVTNSGQFRSYIPTGTPPIAMPTATSGMINNLNVDLLDDLDSSSFLQTTSFILLENGVTFKGTLIDNDERTGMFDGDTLVKLFIHLGQPGGSDTILVVKVFTSIFTLVGTITLLGSASFASVNIVDNPIVGAKLRVVIDSVSSSILIPGDMTVGIISRNFPV